MPQKTQSQLDSLTFQINVDSLTSVIHNQVLDSINSEYLEVLKNTNDQLSSAWTPYGVLLGGLGVLFTIATIAAAFLIWRQSKEYNQRIAEVIENGRDSLEEMEKLYSETLSKGKEAIEETNILHSELTEKLEKLYINARTEEEKKSIKKVYSIADKINDKGISGLLSKIAYQTKETFDTFSKVQTCTSCDSDFISPIKFNSLGTTIVTCTNCNHTQRPVL